MKRLLAVLLATTACVTPPPPQTSDELADRLRYKASTADDDIRRHMYLDELAKAELDRARQANTIGAYRAFLREFPHGAEATTARALLEELRWQEASQAATHEAWTAFLEEHPRGRHASQARAALGRLEIEEALASEELAHVRRTLARWPEHELRGRLAAHEDAMAFSQAKSDGREALEAYLAEHPTGMHRAEAQQLREQLELAAIVEAEDMERALELARRADASGPVRATLWTLQVRESLRALDWSELQRLTKGEREPAIDEVTWRAVSELVRLVGRQAQSREVTALVDAARAGAGLRTRAEIASVLKTGDPMDRVDALRELAEYGDRAAVDEALAQVGNRYVSVGLQAIETLRSLSTSLPAPLWAGYVHSREQFELARALSADPWRRVAALRDASGDTQRALQAWREVLKDDPDDLVARARVMSLEQTTGDRLAFASSARALAKTAASFGDGRWLRPIDPKSPMESRRDGPGQVIGVPAEVTVLRQLCAAIDLGVKAGEALAGLRLKASEGEQELLGLALADNDRITKRLNARRQELEGEARARIRGFRACDEDHVTERIAQSRASRAAALRTLAGKGDVRHLEFVRALERTPSDEVREAARAAQTRLFATAPAIASPLVDGAQKEQPAPSALPPAR